MLRCYCVCLMAESWHSVAVTLSRITEPWQTSSGLWSRSCYCLKFQRTHNTTSFMHPQVLLGSRHLRWWKLTPSLASQVWRHDYVMSHDEYLILHCFSVLLLRYIYCSFCVNLHICHYSICNTGCCFSTQCICWQDAAVMQDCWRGYKVVDWRTGNLAVDWE